MKITRKTVKGWPRSLSAFGANINTEVLDSQHCHRAMIIVQYSFTIAVAISSFCLIDQLYVVTEG